MSFVSTLDFNYEPAKDTWGRRKCWAKVDAKEGDLGKEKAVKITYMKNCIFVKFVPRQAYLLLAVSQQIFLKNSYFLYRCCKGNCNTVYRLTNLNLSTNIYDRIRRVGLKNSWLKLRILHFYS